MLTSIFGWRAVFLVNVPLAGGALVAALTLIRRDSAVDRERSFEIPGAVTVTGAVTLIVLALVKGPNLGWLSPATWSILLTGMVMGVAFIAIERRSRDPLLPFRMLRNAWLALALIVAFFFMATFGALLYFPSIYFQDVLHYDALQTGLTFLLPTTVVVIASALAGRVVTKIGLRLTMIIALSAGAIGALAVGFAISPKASFLGFLPGLIAVSVGDGVTFTAMFIAASTGVPDRQQGVASGIVSTASGIGAVLGLAVLVLVANLGTDNLDGEPLRAAVAAGIARVAYTIACGVLLMLIIVIFRTPSRERIGLRGASSGEVPSP